MKPPIVWLLVPLIAIFAMMVYSGTAIAVEKAETIAGQSTLAEIPQAIEQKCANEMIPAMNGLENAYEAEAVKEAESYTGFNIVTPVQAQNEAKNYSENKDQNAQRETAALVRHEVTVGKIPTTARGTNYAVIICVDTPVHVLRA